MIFPVIKSSAAIVRPAVKLAAALTLAFLAGCSSSADSIYHYYDLDGFTQQVQDTGSGNPVRVNDVKLPDYLDTQSILFQTGPNEVTQTNRNKWIANLGSILTNSLVLRLRKNLPQYSFGENICSQGRDDCPALDMNIRDFRGIYDGTVHTEFDWQIMKGRDLICHGSISRSENQDGDGYDSLVEALNKAWKSSLDDLSGNIDTCLTRLAQETKQK